MDLTTLQLSNRPCLASDVGSISPLPPHVLAFPSGLPDYIDCLIVALSSSEQMKRLTTY